MLWGENMENCIFCKIVEGSIPAYKVYESENFVAFLDIMPINPGHTLIVSKKHFENTTAFPEELGNEFFRVVKKVSEAVVKALGADAYNIGINNGPAAGQVIMHFHAHIIPRFKDDGLKHWPQSKANEEELKNIAEKIKSEVNKI